ncbi:serine hydrolase domain-containing protein [Aurantivibrio plasticivorans]
MNSPIDNLPYANPESVGMSGERLAHIAPAIQRYIDKQLIPGAVTMVARHGKVVYFDSQGLKNIDTQEAMGKDTVFRIASMTKPIVSLALMMLFEEGKFQLHDPISRFLPAFKDMQVMEDDGQGGYRLRPAQREINVRHVLTHTAGFANEYNPRCNGASYKLLKDIGRPFDRSGTIDDFVTRLAQVPLVYEPGTEWDYSRATCVVGRLVEVLSGMSLKDFVETRILQPLGMEDTHFFLPHHKLSRFSASYKPTKDLTIELEDPDSAESFYASADSEFYVGSGGLVSTAADYFRFTDMLRRNGTNGETRIVSRKTLELMRTNHTGNKLIWLSGPGYGFGLGFGVVLDRGKTHAIASEGSYSWGGMFCTHWWNDPQEDLFGMVLTQVRPYDHLNIRSDMQVLATQAIID